MRVRTQRLLPAALLVAFLFLALATAGAIQKKQAAPAARTAAEIARDESFWLPVQEAFDVDRSVINLNNGGVHPAPRVVMNAVHRYLDFANGAPTHNSWGFLRPRKEHVRRLVADTFGCSSEEIALVRNVTEALQIALLGIELKASDEVLTAEHDYPLMKNALFQRQKRDGVISALGLGCVRNRLVSPS